MVIRMSVDGILGDATRDVEEKCRELLLEAEVENRSTVHRPGMGNCGGFFRSHLSVVRPDTLTQAALGILEYAGHLERSRNAYGSVLYDITVSGIEYLNTVSPGRKVEGKWYGPPADAY